MGILQFGRRENQAAPANTQIEALMAGYSIEVMPRTAAKIGDFRTLLPQGTRVYIAHIDGTAHDDMIATAARLRAAGMEPVPHLPARSIPSRDAFAALIEAYRTEARVTEALVLAGGRADPAGPFTSSRDLIETGLLDGFTRLDVAGHPEGNRDIAADGAEDILMEALLWKQDYARAKGIEMSIVTQFLFEAAPAIAWTRRLRAAGITLPVRLGVAGPARLQTLIKFAVACGVGPSLSVLQKRARDVANLVKPYGPDRLIADLSAHKAKDPDSAIAGIHFFPLGGIEASATWAIENGGASARPALQP
ncbi:methylenetetrahydrofolate reductase [Actibacterium sp. XHP0104]|uniref:methylenetetrahydrofolate reductase n=1 Tax=Actibacterium sp. XHP0104 TaxID=2984335 RepID=UPI0021E8B9EF|nr:methylenetetrahydrofolate reductase [Actibacterium sp. XHP0104]MCV2881178.1 methylenetetrahydrofolate reductase [Actibacterium sp. XHP0104]